MSHLYTHTDVDGDAITVFPSSAEPDKIVVDVNGQAVYVDALALFEALGRHLGTDADKEPATEDTAVPTEKPLVDPDVVARFSIARQLLDPCGEHVLAAEEIAHMALLIGPSGD